MGPQIGDVYTTRVFKDDNPKLRVFKLAVFMNLSIGVVDMEDPKNSSPRTEKVIWFAKSDLQFFDLLQAATPPPKAPDEKGN